MFKLLIPAHSTENLQHAGIDHYDSTLPLHNRVK